MTREIVSVNLNGTRFPATIVSKKDFDFMRQEGDICLLYTSTPEIKANGHKVKFLDPDNLKMVVDGKVFIGKEEIDSEINRIDLIGPDMKKVRDKERIKDITKKEIKNITSVGKVSAVRGVVSVPIRSAASGQHTMGALLHGLWAFMQKAMQR